jgi:prophage maintenance system killer protein
VTLRLFIEMNGWTWGRYPDVDETEQAVLAVTSSEWDEERTTAWLRPLLAAPSSSD